MCVNHTGRMEGDLGTEGQEGDGFFEFSTTFFFFWRKIRRFMKVLWENEEEVQR